MQYVEEKAYSNMSFTVAYIHHSWCWAAALRMRPTLSGAPNHHACMHAAIRLHLYTCADLLIT